jgi:hypothetical protein
MGNYIVIKRIHVYDVDGVLLDSAHRHRFIGGELDVDHYFRNCIPELLARDAVLPLAKQYISDCNNSEIYTILCSVRSPEPKHINSITEKIGKPNLMLLVGEAQPDKLGNLKPSDQLKFNRLLCLFNLRQFNRLPRFFWEDSKRNLKTCAKLFTRSFHVVSRGIRK